MGAQQEIQTECRSGVTGQMEPDGVQLELLERGLRRGPQADEQTNRTGRLGLEADLLDGPRPQLL